MEFEKDGVDYIVSIKSGPNWGNADQIRKMRDNFKVAGRDIRRGNPQAKVVAVNGCCSGRDSQPKKKGYLKLCGQEFWEFISGDSELYTQIIEPLGFKAKEKNEKFAKEYAKIVTNFTVELAQDFCVDGEVDWKKLVQFNSASTPRILLGRKGRS